MLEEDAKTKGGFNRVFPPVDNPTTIDETPTLSLNILGPATPHVGKSAPASGATDAAIEALTRCRSFQRKYRNVLLFVGPDEARLSNARVVMRQSMAWASIVAEARIMQQQPTQGQAADAQEKAKADSIVSDRLGPDRFWHAVMDV